MKDQTVQQPEAQDPSSGSADRRCDEATLLQRIGVGDETALAGLYDALGTSVYGLACRVVRDPARAEEITQEVFLQVWQQAPRFDPHRGAARTWVMTLAHRRTVDVVRHDQAATDRDRRYWAGSERAYDVVSEAVMSNLEHEHVKRCLDDLTELQREAIALAYYQGYTYREVASMLKANLSAVKTRIRDGLIRLRDCLGVDA